MSISRATFHLTLLSSLASAASAAAAMDASVSADYSSAFVTSDPIMTFGLRAEQALPYDLRLSLAQSMNRNLVLDDSKKEWEWNDTVITLKRPLNQAEDVSWLAQLSATLPTSIESQHDELRTRPELRVSASVKLPWNGSAVTGASYAAYWHKYDSTRPEGQSSGGEALPRYTYSFDQNVSFKFREKFVAGLGGSYRVKRYYDLKQTEGYIAARNRLEEYSYSLSADGTYLYSKRTSLTLSYNNGSGLERPGYNDFVIYDKEQSAWSVSLLHLL